MARDVCPITRSKDKKGRDRKMELSIFARAAKKVLLPFNSYRIGHFKTVQKVSEMWISVFSYPWSVRILQPISEETTKNKNVTANKKKRGEKRAEKMMIIKANCGNTAKRDYLQLPLSSGACLLRFRSLTFNLNLTLTVPKVWNFI